MKRKPVAEGARTAGHVKLGRLREEDRATANAVGIGIENAVEQGWEHMTSRDGRAAGAGGGEIREERLPSLTDTLCRCGDKDALAGEPRVWAGQGTFERAPSRRLP